jgi:mono/diheme cytochrome c family protein
LILGVNAMKKGILLFVGALGVVLNVSWVFAQDSQGDSQRGQAIYQQHCLRCHGFNGNGEGPDAPFLIVPPTNFFSEQSRVKADLELLMVIAHGSIFSPMHGWRGQLTDQEMWDVLRYIRQLAPFKAIAKTEIRR